MDKNKYGMARISGFIAYVSIQMAKRGYIVDTVKITKQHIIWIADNRAVHTVTRKALA